VTPILQPDDIVHMRVPAVESHPCEGDQCSWCLPHAEALEEISRLYESRGIHVHMTQVGGFEDMYIIGVIRTTDPTNREQV
jgi:hypothetical protein